MEFRHLAICISLLFSLAVVGESHNGDEVVAGEDYWQAVWPNTPIPSALRELLNPGPPSANKFNVALPSHLHIICMQDVKIDDLPMAIDDTQYPKNFFFEHELYPGKTMKVEFSKRPFAQPYGVYLFLKDAKDVDREGYTFEELCVKKGPSKGEHSFCAKSLGALIGFAISKLGKNIQFLSSSFVDKENQYTVEGVQNLGDRAVMCHRLNFQKTVLYCHETNETTVFMVQLVAGNGRKTQALAVCHGDTSGMNREMLHQIMKVDTGNNPVCHFLGNKAVLWVPNLVLGDADQSNIAS